MAPKKTYVVKKDDEIIEQFKTLVASRKLADMEGAEVFCDGELVYTGTVEDTPETMILPADPVVEKQPEAKGPATERYRLKTLMNVRKKPSLYAEVLSTKPKDTVVHVLGVEDDWLHLIDGSFILFEDGKYAEKI